MAHKLETVGVPFEEIEKRPAPQRDRWPLHRRVILSVSVLVLIGALACAVLDTPSWSYNGTRLMPSFLLAYGHKVFELHGRGPLYSTLYGPLTYIVYLPATIFRTPNAAVLAGSTLTVCLCLLCVAWLHFGGGRWRRDFWPSLLGFTAAVYLICFLEPLRYSCVNIHADGPGLVFGGAACAVLRWRGRWRLGILGSATLCVMAALCKQPLAMLSVGLLLYLALADGARAALRYLKALCIAGLALGSALLWAFGPSELFYNVVAIAIRHPWQASGAAGIVQPLRVFVRLMFPVLVVAAMVLVIAWKQGAWKTRGRQWLRANDWTILFVAGLALLPSSLAGLAKIGGDINSLSFAGFFITLGVTCMLADLAGAQSEREVRQIARGCLWVVILLLMVVELPVGLVAKVRTLSVTEQQTVFEYLKSNGSTTYFPWFPLSHLFAEGRFYHSGYGIADRVLAGEQVGPQYFQAYAPAHMSSIVFGKDGSREIVGVDLLSFWGASHACAVEHPPVATWEMYRDSPSPCSVVAAAAVPSAGE
jgi:hypothetical protein